MISVKPTDPQPTPTVDIVVPCYNYARYLEACVRSVLDQPGVEVRVLVIDDHSSDDTSEVAARLCRTDARVRFRRHEQNRGHIATFNEGLSEAAGDYVVLLSADDLLAPGALQRAHAVFEAHPSVGLVYGHPIALYDDNPQPARTRPTGATVWCGHDWLGLICRAGRNFINCPEAVMRTTVQHRIGGYRPSLPHSGDMEMWLRAATVADVARINGADQAYYRIHPLSMQRTTNAGVLRDLAGRLEAIESALEGGAAAVPDAPALLERARASLAVDAVAEAGRAFKNGRGQSVAPEACLAFALATWPAVQETPVWRSVQRLRHPPAGLLDLLLRRGSARVDEWRSEWVWRRWRRTGVY